MSTGNLSPEEKEVNRLINESKLKIEKLEKQIKDLPRDQGLDQRFNMSGGPQPHAPGKNAELKREAKEAIEKEKKTLTEKVDKALSGSSAETKEKGQKNLTSFLYPDKVKENERSEQKTISASQGYAMKLRFGGDKEFAPPAHERAREKDLDSSQEFANKLKSAGKEKTAADPANTRARQKELSASQDFAMKLRFMAQKEPEKEEAEKPALDKSDQIEGMSMSLQFSQSLRFSQLEEGGAADWRKREIEKDQDKEPEKE